MKENDARKLWLIISLVLFVLTWSLWGRLQGSSFTPQLTVLVALIFEKEVPHAIVAMWGILLCALISIAVNLLTHEHGKIIGTSWKSRYPYRLWEADPEYGIGRVAQGAALVVFTLLPMAALVHFWKVMLREGRLCRTKEGQEVAHLLQFPPGWKWHHPWNNSWLLAGEGGCGKGTTTFEPVIQPILWAAVTAVAVFCFALAMRTLFLLPVPAASAQSSG